MFTHRESKVPYDFLCVSSLCFSRFLPPICSPPPSRPPPTSAPTPPALTPNRLHRRPSPDSRRRRKELHRELFFEAFPRVGAQPHLADRRRRKSDVDRRSWDWETPRNASLLLVSSENPFWVCLSSFGVR